MGQGLAPSTIHLFGGELSEAAAAVVVVLVFQSSEETIDSFLFASVCVSVFAYSFLH